MPSEANGGRVKMLRFACGLTKNSSDMTGMGTDDELLFLIGAALIDTKTKRRHKCFSMKSQGPDSRNAPKLRCILSTVFWHIKTMGCYEETILKRHINLRGREIDRCVY